VVNRFVFDRMTITTTPIERNHLTGWFIKKLGRKAAVIQFKQRLQTATTDRERAVWDQVLSDLALS